MSNLKTKGNFYSFFKKTFIDTGVKFFGQVTGTVNGINLQEIDRTVIMKPDGQISSKVKSLSDENLKNLFSVLIMLNGATPWVFADLLFPNRTNVNHLTKNAIFSSKTNIVFGNGETPGKKLKNS